MHLPKIINVLIYIYKLQIYTYTHTAQKNDRKIA